MEWTPLNKAASYSHLAIVQYLNQHGAQIDAKIQITKRTPLTIAVIKNHIDVVKCLLENGALMEDKDRFGCTSVFYAQDQHTAKFLIDHGAQINVKNNIEQTPLHQTLFVVSRNYL